MCSYGLKATDEPTDGQMGRQTDGQTEIYKLLIYVQHPIEWYMTHGCCSKKLVTTWIAIYLREVLFRHNYLSLANIHVNVLILIISCKNSCMHITIAYYLHCIITINSDIK